MPRSLTEIIKEAGRIGEEIGLSDVDVLDRALEEWVVRGAQSTATLSDEPTFTIFGRDQLAQATIVHWIERARVAGVSKEKIERALQRYEEIVAFQSENPDRVKTPD